VNVVGGLAEHDAVVPPLAPTQVQFQGPVPVIAVAMPELQNPVVGAEVNVWLLEEPHTPLTDSNAEQLAVVPPLAPTQVQFHGPAPDTAVAVPELQNPVDGAEVSDRLLEEPQVPGVCNRAEQFAVIPPPEPTHDQLHGPVPVIDDAAPLVHKLVNGTAVKPAPLAEPQTPLTGGSAEQLAVVPPLLPTQVQFQGPVPVTAVAVPELQNPVVGAEANDWLLEEPQEPEFCNRAEQLAVPPPPVPAHDQLHGPVPVTDGRLPS